jgi:hypothetical protein
MATWSTAEVGQYRFEGRTTTGVMDASEAAPAAAGDGMSMEDLDAVLVEATAASGTFDGSGDLLAYRQAPGASSWKPFPEANLNLADANGLSTLFLAAIPVNFPLGRLAYRSNGANVGLTLVMYGRGKR